MKPSKEHNDNSLSIYMKEAGKYDLLTKEEETQLFKILHSKTRKKIRKEVRERIIKSNLKLVVKIAKEYRNLGLDYEDLIEEGNIGLMTAVDKFNPKKGAKLSYYASFWIKQTIRRAISNKGRTIRLPVAVVESKLKVSKYVEDYESKNDDSPTDEQIANATGLSNKKVKLLTSLGFQSDSLNRVIQTEEAGEESELQSLIQDKSVIDPAQLFLKKDGREVLMKLVDNLEERQRYIIIHRFGLGNTERQTLETIGKKFNLTRERIRQLETAALENLRDIISGKNEI